MALLTRDQILSADDIPSEIVKVPEWGGSVRVKGLTGAERDRFEESFVRERKGRREVNMANFRAKLAALCIVDEKGERLFSDNDIAFLGQKSAAALARVHNVASRLSGLSQQDIDELTEGFDEGQSGDLPSA